MPDEPSATFLIELVAPGLTASGATRLAETLQHAAARLRASGVAVTWQCGFFVPPGRCLVLVDADSAGVAQRVRDIAGVSTAVVHPVQRLAGDRPGSDSTHLVKE